MLNDPFPVLSRIWWPTPAEETVRLQHSGRDRRVGGDRRCFTVNITAQSSWGGSIAVRKRSW